MVLQELVSRGRIIFKSAPKRFEVFKLVNGRRSVKDIANEMGKSIQSTLNDLNKMKDMELIKAKRDKDGNIVRKNSFIIYEKNPLIKHLSDGYFYDPIKIQKRQKVKQERKRSISKSFNPISIPSEKNILDICTKGETQLYEFKSAGTEARKISKEICGFANTKLGGIIFYGIDDDGIISGSDKSLQELDQPLQNSINNTISPSLVIGIFQKEVIGRIVIIIRIKPWNRKDVFHYEKRVYIRKGTNAFPAEPEDSKKLHLGKYVI